MCESGDEGFATIIPRTGGSEMRQFFKTSISLSPISTVSSSFSMIWILPIVVPGLTQDTLDSC